MLVSSDWNSYSKEPISLRREFLTRFMRLVFIPVVRRMPKPPCRTACRCYPRSLTFPKSFPKTAIFPLLSSDLLRNLTRGNGPSLVLRPTVSCQHPQRPPGSLGHRVRNRGLFLSSEGSCFIVWSPGTKRSSSKWSESCFERVESERFIACSNFHVAFVPLAQLTELGSPPAS